MLSRIIQKDHTMTKTSTVTTFKQLGAHLAGKRVGRPEMIAIAMTPGPPNTARMFRKIGRLLAHVTVMQIYSIFLCTFAVFMVLYL